MEVSKALLSVDNSLAFEYNENLVNWLQNAYWAAAEMLLNSIDLTDPTSATNIQNLKVRTDVLKELLSKFEKPE